MIIKRHADANWTETGAPGITTARPWDTPAGDGGYLTRFKAGASFPRHAHDGGWEQIYILEGRIRFNDDELVPGDTLYMENKDEHQALALEDTLIIVAHHGNV